MAARHKLWAEGLLEETKMILGWRWDFRRLIISLPINKCTPVDRRDKQND
jgi:hypothetical protein